MEDGLPYCLSLSLKFTIITRPPVLFALFRYDAPIGPLAGSFHTSAQTMVPQSGVRVLERPRRQHLRPYWNAGRLQRLNNSDRQGVLAGCRSPLALASLSTSARLGGLFLGCRCRAGNRSRTRMAQSRQGVGRGVSSGFGLSRLSQPCRSG